MLKARKVKLSFESRNPESETECWILVAGCWMLDAGYEGQRTDGRQRSEDR